MADEVEFYQIFYKEDQRSNLYPFAIPYFNDTLTPFFENSVISDLVMRTDADKIAVCSWVLRDKIASRIPPRPELTEERLHEDFDVMSFTKNAPSHDMLTALETWHPGATETLQIIWNELGYQMPKKAKYPIYQNAFCATIEVYADYVINFLIPAMYLMEFDKEIRQLCYHNANYTRTILGKPVDFDRIEKYIGIRYYPMHPFLLERCFSLWIQNKDLKVVYL